jgi:hypothetical protein
VRHRRPPVPVAEHLAGCGRLVVGGVEVSAPTAGRMESRVDRFQSHGGNMVMPAKGSDFFEAP